MTTTFDGRSKLPRGVTTVLVFLLIGAGLGAWAITFTHRAAAPAATPPAIAVSAGDPEKLTVITANVRFSDPGDGVNVWPNRRELLVKTLLKYNPDIIGCQEVTPAQGAYLLKEFASWYTHYPRAGVGKIEGASASRAGQLMGEVTATFASLNTLFYRTSRFEQVDGMAGLAVPDEPQAVPSENTFFTLAVLKEKSDGAMFIVVDTHIRHHADFAIKCAMHIRENIAAALKKYPNSAVVVMGDMNHNRTSPIYGALLGNATEVGDGLGALVDSFDYSKKRPNENWGNWHEFTGIAKQPWPSDLILTNAQLRSEGAELIRDGGEKGIWPSDHFFVRAEFTRLVSSK